MLSIVFYKLGLFFATYNHTSFKSIDDNIKFLHTTKLTRISGDERPSSLFVTTKGTALGLFSFHVPVIIFLFFKTKKNPRNIVNGRTSDCWVSPSNYEFKRAFARKGAFIDHLYYLDQEFPFTLFTL